MILDDVGLSKQKLLYAQLCTTIQTILEVVNRTCRNNTVLGRLPNIHDAQTEET